MSEFLAVTGLNPGDAKTMLGGDTSSGSAQASQASDFYPKYVLLDQTVMMQIERHYKQEPLIATANSIKSDYNLGIDGFDVLFADKTLLDDDKFHHLEAVNRLMEQARQAKEMFGFVLVQDSSELLEKNVREITGESLEDDDDDDPDAEIYAAKSNYSGLGSNTLPVIDAEQKLTEQASKYMHRAATALGLADVRSELLGNVKKFGTLQRNVDSGVTTSTYPQNGPALPPIVIGSASDSTLSGEAAAQKADSTRGNLPAAEQDDESESRVKESKRKVVGFEQLFTRIRNLKVVNYRDYEIYLRINRFTNERDLVACRRRTKKKAEEQRDYIEAHRDQRLPKSATIDETVTIFVWPGRMPSDEGEINTQMHDAIRKLWKLEAADQRLVIADESATRPTVFLSYDEKLNVGDMRELSEQELLGLATQPTAKESRLDARQVISAYRATVAMDMLNGKRVDELSRRIASGQELPTGETRTRQAAYRDPESSSEKVVPLPRGFTTGAVVSGKSIDNVESRRTEYKEHIAGMVGIPLIHLNGGMGSSKKASAGGGSAAVTGGSAELSSGLLRTTIMKDRADLSEFFQSVMEVFFREMSNTELALVLSTARREKTMIEVKHEALLATLRAQYELITEAAQKISVTRFQSDAMSLKVALVAHFQAISDAARRVSSMSNRFSIKFKRQTFIEYYEIEMLKAEGALLPFEAANIMRAKMSLEPLTKEQFEENRKTIMRHKREEAESLRFEHTPDGDGASSSASTSQKKRSPSPAPEEPANSTAKKAKK